MFEDRTYENLLAEALENAPADIDIRQGSIFYDAVAGQCQIIARSYAEMSELSDYISLDTCTGSQLDKYAEEHALTRISASHSKYSLTYTGTEPPKNSRFYTDNMYFTYDGDYLIAETAGSSTASVVSGATAIPVNTISGLTSASFGSLYSAGEDEESDSDLRQRIKEKISNQSENGNKSHYKTWCESVTGVGRARIKPLWDGANTVKGVLYGTDGKPAGSSVVSSVQSYIDPDSTGLGEGVANIGAVFTAVAATTVDIAVAATVELNTGYTKAQAETAATTAITAYLKTLALDTEEGTDVIVRVSAIGQLLLACDEIADYSNLTVNEASANVTVADTECAVLSAVAFVEAS